MCKLVEERGRDKEGNHVSVKSFERRRVFMKSGARRKREKEFVSSFTGLS